MADQAFLLDLGRCIGCQACSVACAIGNELSAGEYLIEIGEWTRGSFPAVRGGVTNHRCYHCAEAACVAVCPTGALYKENGLTRLDRSKCSGCGYCVEACPYGVPTLVGGRASKCDGCADTVASGREPWCVATCPSKALEYGERSVILAEADRRAIQMQGRDADASVYGASEAGGLGLIVVMPCGQGSPETTSSSRRARCRAGEDVLGLPDDPGTPGVVGVWQDVVQPAAIGLTAATAVAAGVGAVIARRNHLRELEELEKAGAAGPSQEAQ